LFIYINNKTSYISFFSEDGDYYCIKSNYLIKLSIKCERDIFAPDLKGGYEGAKTWLLGNNYCKECDEDSKLYKTCEDVYFPFENGGCSYTNNCEISDLENALNAKIILY